MSTINGFDFMLLGVIAVLAWTLAISNTARRLQAKLLSDVVGLVGRLYQVVTDEGVDNELSTIKDAQEFLKDHVHPFVPRGDGRCRICSGHIGLHLAPRQRWEDDPRLPIGTERE